jgi:hypothetical protein
MVGWLEGLEGLEGLEALFFIVNTWVYRTTKKKGPIAGVLNELRR